MKKLCILLSFAPFAAISQQTIVYDENAQVRTVTGSFHAIKAGSGITVYLTKGETEQVAVSASKEEYRDKIITEVNSEGELVIKYKGTGLQISLNPAKNNPRLKVYVSYKALDKIEASGASNIKIMDALSASKLNIVISGASNIKGKINVSDLTVNASGASDADLEGKAVSATIHASGASDVKAYNLETDTCSVHASGASDISITVNKELDAKASGASDISFKGNPVVKKMDSGGASSIKKKA